MSGCRTTAFLFGPEARRRYGVLHEPSGTRVRVTGVVLCGPFPTERNDTMRSLRRLADGLANDGFPTLRFDASGTGDSWGEVDGASADAWRDDVGLAIEALQARSGVARTLLIGVRWGAALAWEHRRHASVHAIGLWEPVLDGAAYVASLRTSHQAWLVEEAQQRPQAMRYASSHEVLGCALPIALADAMQQIVVVADPTLRKRVAVFARPDASVALGSDVMVSRHALLEPAVWAHEAGMDAPPVATVAIARICAWAAEAG